MIEAPYYSASGQKHSGGFALPADLFDGTVNEPVLHQAVKTFLANQRQGTAKTKVRKEVSGGNQKPWRQKGTGRARQGSTRAPHWRGGGTVFGPIPRDYRAELPRKVRQLARRSALNARAREAMVRVIDPLTLEAPKTKALVALLDKLALGGTKTLLLTAGAKPAVHLSGRNMPLVRVLPFADASAYDILAAEALVIEAGALGTATETAEPAAERKPRATRAAAPRKAAAPKTAKAAKAPKAAPRKPRAKKESE
jgi:large subunit ribosomal protein L4